MCVGCSNPLHFCIGRAPPLLSLLPCAVRISVQNQRLQLECMKHRHSKAMLALSAVTRTESIAHPLFFFSLSPLIRRVELGVRVALPSRGLPRRAQRGTLREGSCPGAENSPTEPRLCQRSAYGEAGGRNTANFHAKAAKTLTFSCQSLAVASESCDICIDPVTTEQ